MKARALVLCLPETAVGEVKRSAFFSTDFWHMEILSQCFGGAEERFGTAKSSLGKYADNMEETMQKVEIMCGNTL